MADRDKQKYYRSISRYFFQLRGAPFFLSPKELTLIENWEARRIPLVTVLEGIRAAYEERRQRPGAKNFRFSLLACERHVLRAFSQFRERRVGRTKPPDETRLKRDKIKSNIEKFLSHIPEEVRFLQPIFLQILTDLSVGKMDDSALEQAEERIESLMLKNASDADKARAHKESLALGKLCDTMEMEQIVQVWLIKNLRNTHKIPHVSLYYY